MLEIYSDIQFNSYKVYFLEAELLTHTYGYFYGIFLTKGVPWYGSLRRALNRGANTFPRNGGTIARKQMEMKNKNQHLSTPSPTFLLEVF